MAEELQNVFVLGSGRCGTMTFAAACGHMDNWTASHEANTDKLFHERLDYPRGHIEVDNRLCWMLGRLERAYGPAPLYVHLYRDPMEAAVSYGRRTFPGSILNAYAHGIIIPPVENGALPHPPEKYALDMLDTITANIELFLKDKPRVMRFPLHRAKELWPVFWKRVSARGNYEKSLASWDQRLNAS